MGRLRDMMRALVRPTAPTTLQETAPDEPTMVRFEDLSSEDQAAFRAYMGASYGPAYQTWHAPPTGANTEFAYQLPTLRNRARDLVRNNPLARRAKRTFVTHLIGPDGLWPRCATEDAELNKLVDAAFRRWARVCSPSSRLGWGGMQAVLAGAWWESGEVLGRARPRRREDGIPCNFQVQVLEADYLDPFRDYMLPGQGRIVKGVEFDMLDRRVNYWLFPKHPGETLYSLPPDFISRPIPADSVFHLYEERRPGQVRGETFLHAAIPLLWDMLGYNRAEGTRKKLVASQAFWVEDTSTQPDLPALGGGIGPGASAPVGLPQVRDNSGNPIQSVKPGWVLILPSGKKIIAPQPPTDYGFRDANRVMGHEFCSAVDMSYEAVTGDLAEVNFSSIRLGLNEQQLVAEHLRKLVFQPLVLDAVWEWFCQFGAIAGELPMEALDEPYPHEWSEPRRWSYDPQTDVDVAIKRVAACMSSVEREIHNDGLDPGTIYREIARGNEARDEAGIVSIADPRVRTPQGNPVVAPAAAPTQPSVASGSPTPRAAGSGDAVPPKQQANAAEVAAEESPDPVDGSGMLNRRPNRTA